MNESVFGKICHWLATVLIAFGTGVFWTFLISELIRYVFELNEDMVLIYFGGPLFVIYFVWCCRVLSRIFSRRGEI